MRTYKTYGAFEIPCAEENGYWSFVSENSEEAKDFWKEVDLAGKGHAISQGIGCYVISMRTPGGSKPWYVGLTVKRSFERECLRIYVQHLLRHVLQTKGTPQLHLIVKFTSGGKLAKHGGGKRSHSDINRVEDHLIRFAYDRNRKLVNSKGLAFVKGHCIEGILNSPAHKLSKGASTLRQVFGLS